MPPAKQRRIDGLECLDGEGLEWQWKVAPWDFHCGFDAELRSWFLEQFESRVKDAEKAHREEFECESLQDALLCSLDC